MHMIVAYNHLVRWGSPPCIANHVTGTRLETGDAGAELNSNPCHKAVRNCDFYKRGKFGEDYEGDRSSLALIDFAKSHLEAAVATGGDGAAGASGG